MALRAGSQGNSVVMSTVFTHSQSWLVDRVVELSSSDRTVVADRVQAWSWSLLYFFFVLLSATAAWSYRHAIAQRSGCRGC
jgi:hypothetical protein